MYLVQFINPVKSLIAIHAVMSQKFEFACNNGDAPGVRLERGRWRSDECTNRSKSAFGTESSRMRSIVDNVENI